MCERLKIGVKGVSRFTPQKAFVPCGKCKECRDNLRLGWTFRLRAEFEHLKKLGWWFGFVTLTYNDCYLPHLPGIFVKKGVDFSNLPQCFNKHHVRDFIVDFRQWLFRKYDAVRRVKDGRVIKDERLRFLIGAELGESTKRSHYHMVLALPPSVPPQEVHKYIKSRWYLGFVFPRNFNGGLDGKGYNHSPFVVDSVGCATAYASKYVCKDLGFYESVNLANLRKKVVVNVGCEQQVFRLSDYFPFHMQSKSLGACFLDGLDDSKKMTLLTVGHAFMGESAFRHLPVYLKNKLIYNNYYVYDKDGKRLCCRKANDFFKRNYKAIFEKKVDFYEEVFKKYRASESLVSKYFSEPVLAPLRAQSYNALSVFGSETPRYLAASYLACGHVNKAMCYNMPLADLWFSRYLCERDSLGVYDLDFEDHGLLDADWLRSLDFYVDMMQFICNEERLKLDSIELKNARRLEFVKQYFKEAS